MSDINEQNIDFANFFNAETGLKFSIKNGSKIFIPKYRNIFNKIITSGSYNSSFSSSYDVFNYENSTEIVFKDEWASNSFLSDDNLTHKERIKLQDIFDIPSQNILWDTFTEILSFKDIEVEEVTLSEFVKDIDSFLVFNKLKQFGNVWWHKRVSTNGIDPKTGSNVFISTTPGISSSEEVRFWSPDKYINDEYKKYLKDPTNYSGPVNTIDFISGGWFSLPELSISTKPFEKQKIAYILLNLNINFEPEYTFGHYYDVVQNIETRIKDVTSNQEFFNTKLNNRNNDEQTADTLLLQWVGGLFNTQNIQNIGNKGSYIKDECDFETEEVEETETVISHKIDAQISLNPEYDSTKPDVLGTIDPINWISTNEQKNARDIGILNIPRSFGKGSGSKAAGIVTGGLINKDNIQNVLSSSEIWRENEFVQSITPSLNSPRCFHIQGGVDDKSCVILGGYGSFNTETSKEFSEWSKSDPKSDCEVYISNDDLSLSYFMKIPDMQTNIPRGDFSGYLNVNSSFRQDKFQIDNILKTYKLDQTDESDILNFTTEKSGTDNNIRYTSTNVKGFIFGGNTTGNSNLINSAGESSVNVDGTFYDEVVDVYESINSTHVTVGQIITSNSISNYVIDSPEKIIKDVVTVNGNDTEGQSITLDECGKYRIEYINGGFNINKRTIQETVIIKGWDEYGVIANLPYAGTYKLEAFDFGVQDPTNGGTCINNSIEIDSTSAIGTSIVLNKCGSYTVTYSSGFPKSNTGPDAYSISVKVYVDGLYFTTLFEGCYASEQILIPKPSANLCIDITKDNPNKTVTFIYNDEDCETPENFANNVGTLFLSLTYNGKGNCACTNNAQPVELFINDNLHGIAFQTDDSSGASYIFCSPLPNSELRMRYKDNNYADNNQSEGSIVGRLTYISEECLETSRDPESFGWSSQLSVKINSTDEIFIFDNNQPTLKELESFVQNRPSRKIHDFCVTEANSTVKIRTRTPFADNDTSENVRVLYIGKSDCSCSSPLEETNVNTTVDDILINYISVNNELKYPVRCHGHVYVGSDEEGLSTGGRCEYNDIATVTQNIFNKYKDYYSFDSSSLTQSNYEEHRVLDLTFEYKNQTWTRKENLLESVYWHCGLGDNNYALFWGGIHDTVGNYSYKIERLDRNIANFSKYSFLCDDSVKIFDKNVETFFGTDYIDAFNEYEEEYASTSVTTSSDATLGSYGQDSTSYVDSSGIYNSYFSDVNSYYDQTFIIYEDDKTQSLVMTDGRARLFWENTAKDLEFINFNYSIDNITPSNTFISWDNIGSRSVDGTTVAPSSFSISASDTLTTYAYQYGSANILSGGESRIQVSLKYENSKLYFRIVSTGRRTNIAGHGAAMFKMTLFTVNTFTSTSEYKVPTNEVISTINECWIAPPWKTAVPEGYLFDDPRYRNLQDTLQYSSNSGYPGFKVVSVYPANPATISSQDSTNINVDRHNGRTVLSLNKTVEEGGYFRIYGILNETNTTTTGTIQISDVNITVSSQSTPMYPSDILAITTPISADTKYFEFTDIQVLGDNSVKVYYTYSEQFDYLSVTPTESSSPCDLCPTIKELYTINISNTSIIYNCYGNNIWTPTSKNVRSATPNYPWSGKNSTQSNICSFENTEVDGDFRKDICLLWQTAAQTWNSPYTGDRWIVKIVMYNKNVNLFSHYTYYGPYDKCNPQGTYGSPWTNSGCMPGSTPGEVFVTVSDELSPDKSFTMKGNGILSFASIEDVYQAAISNRRLEATQNVFTITENSSLSTVPYDLKNILCNIRFRLDAQTGVMVGVVQKDQEWNSSIKQCGPNISDIVNATINFCPISDIRWGVPIITKGLYDETGSFVIHHNHQLRTPTGEEEMLFDVTTVDGSAYNFGSLLNGRILIKGDTIREEHYYKEFGVNYDLTSTPCISSSGNIDINFPYYDTNAGEYAEYVTNFVQEYRSDSRFKNPEKYIQSNGYGFQTSKQTYSDKTNTWKRYMDGVGLGGDVPDFDTIVKPDKTGKYEVHNWKPMNMFHIGQICFGDTTSAVVVGGHEINRDNCSNGEFNGYHSAETTNRVFIWDYNIVPEEDSYLTNYLGRKLFNDYNDSVKGSSFSVTIFDAEYQTLYERTGTIYSNGDVSEMEVTFSEEVPEEYSTYSLSLTPTENVQVWWENKTRVGFTLKMETPFKGNIDYTIIGSREITQTDISNIGELDGFNFGE